MVITFFNSVLEYVTNNSNTFNFRIDSEGRVVFISDNQFKVEQTLLVELLVSGNHIPTNFETEGHIVVNHGNVYIEYTTYFDEDDEDDTEEGFKSFTIS
jgi:hypothetical protein